ncbi:MAG: DUF1294 domain-containing protein [Clostridia bacterium]|nr:DUF1294 domain-containing protein [Clostridia bacterium]
MTYAFLIVWAVMSAIAFAAYAYDKIQAKRSGWRVKERTLLLLALFMGAPGALAAMYTLRHKTLKFKFTLSAPLFLVLQAMAFYFLIL